MNFHTRICARPAQPPHVPQVQGREILATLQADHSPAKELGGGNFESHICVPYISYIFICIIFILYMQLL